MDKDVHLINEGSFGCIFYPGINCKGNKENIKYITKIQISEKTLVNEMNISKKIMKIPDYKLHFSPIIKQCPVEIKNEKYKNEIQKCGVFKDIKLNSKDYVSNKIRYVGNTNISEHIMNQTNLYDLWRELLETHIYLLTGINKLLERNIVHYDIKYNNIMYDKTIRKPIFIDFGLSIDMQDINSPPPTAEESIAKKRTAYYVFDTYDYWCAEVCICNYISREITFDKANIKKITKEELSKILDVFVYGNTELYEKNINNGIFTSTIVKNGTEANVAQFEKKFINFYEKYINKTWWELYEDIIIHKTYYTTWDNYALSIVYLFIIEDIKNYNAELYNQMKTQTEKQYTMYMNLLETNIYEMTDERLSVENTIKYLRTIEKTF